EDILARPEGKEGNSSLLSTPIAKARQLTEAQILQKFTSARQRWVDLLGESGWETLYTVVEQYTDGAADGHQRNWKGSISKAVATKRKVSRVQAQADLRRLREKMSKALAREQRDRHAEGLVYEIWDLFRAQGEEAPGLGVYEHKRHGGTLLSSRTREQGIEV